MDWATKNGVSRAISIPAAIAAFAGFYGGSAACTELLLAFGQPAAQARFIGFFVGGAGGGILCAGAVFILLWRWVRRP